jgi:hypothetical protein
MAKRRGRRHSKRQHGGNVGAAYSVGPDVLVKGMPYLVNEPISNCQAVAPGYTLSASQIAAVNGGLPGMKGGRRRKSAKRGYRKMRGGRYEVSPMPLALGTPNVIDSINRIACEAGQGSPQPSPTVPTEPPVGPLPNLPGPSLATIESVGTPGYNANISGSSMRGGALVPPYSGGTPLEETTAGYSHFRSASDMVTQTQSGVPFMVNVPSGGQLGVSNACTTVPGGTLNANLGNTMKGGAVSGSIPTGQIPTGLIPTGLRPMIPETIRVNVPSGGNLNISCPYTNKLMGGKRKSRKSRKSRKNRKSHKSRK